MVLKAVKVANFMLHILIKLKNSAFWISGVVVFQNTCFNESSWDVGGTQEAIGIILPRLFRGHLCKAQFIS